MNIRTATTFAVMTMSMVRFQRVAQLWNWLPGFRGVAEHESVHQAAEALAISPSSLSRTVKLLESALGAALFVRRSGRLERTPLGEELLALTRTAMRSIDDCITREDARRGGAGAVFVGVTSDLGAAIVARTVAKLTGDRGPIHISRLDEETGSDELLRGSVDLVIAHADPRARGLVALHLGEATYGIYVAADRPIRVDNELVDAPLVTTTFGPPVPAEARVVCTCESSDVTRMICESSALFGVLPDLLVAERTSLRRVSPLGDPFAVHAVRRTPLASAEDSRLVSLIDEVRATVSEHATPRSKF